MFIVYAILGAGWGWLCYQNREDLLPIQNYLSSLLGFLVVEMVANWGKIIISKNSVCRLTCISKAYYRYLNAHGKGTTSTVFLIVGMSFLLSALAFAYICILQSQYWMLDETHCHSSFSWSFR